MHANTVLGGRSTGGVLLLFSSLFELYLFLLLPFFSLSFLGSFETLINCVLLKP